MSSTPDRRATSGDYIHLSGEKALVGRVSNAWAMLYLREGALRQERVHLDVFGYGGHLIFSYPMTLSNRIVCSCCNHMCLLFLVELSYIYLRGSLINCILIFYWFFM